MSTTVTTTEEITEGSPFQRESAEAPRLINSIVTLTGLPAPTRSRRNPPTNVTYQPTLAVEALPAVEANEGCPTEAIHATQFVEIPDRELATKLTRKEQRRLQSTIQQAERLLPALEIEAIQLSYWDSKELSQRAVVKITDGKSSGKNTINDLRLGVINGQDVCFTCAKTVLECPGHIGVIELNVPIYHPMVFRYLIAVLTSVCNSCGGLLLTKEELEAKGIIKYTGIERLMMIETESKNKVCRRPTTEDCTPTSCTITENDCNTARTAIVDGRVVPDPIIGVVPVPSTLSTGPSAPVILPIASSAGPAEPPLLPIEEPFESFAMLVGSGPIQRCNQNPIFKVRDSDQKKKVLYNCTANDKTPRILSIDTVNAILNGISEEDAQLLGFSPGEHPRKLIITALPVIPPCSRTINVKDAAVYTDSLGDQYKTIVNVNNEIPNTRERSAKRDTLIKNLTSAITELIKYEDTGQRRGRRGFKSFRDLLQTKKGLFRQRLMGKRVNFSGRSVASVDPTLLLSQVGIPRAWASYLTVPKTVTNFNQGELLDLLRSGRVNYVVPGTGRDSGNRIVINERNRDTFDLKVGDQASRWLQNGDYVIVNRQPTLHREGMMGYAVVLHDDLTVDIHPSVTTPHNADFDGDELNIHMVQTEEAMREVAEVMSVSKCLMNAQSNKPMIAMIQDALTGIHLLTDPKTRIDEDTWFDINSILLEVRQLVTLERRLKKYHLPMYVIEEKEVEREIDTPEGIRIVKTIERIKMYTGRALFSALLPEDFYYQKGKEDEKVTIIDGILVQGIITKQHIGTSHNSIIQELWKKYGEERTMGFLADAPAVANRYLMERGFSVGLKDCYLPNREDRRIAQEELARAQLQIQSGGARADSAVEKERQERDIIVKLDRVHKVGARVAKENIPKDNSFGIMARSGGKGSAFTITQITTMLGQMFIAGERMPHGLPYFEKGDLNPEARGFVTSSFAIGLGPAEFVYSQTAGREGLADTAVKTSFVGYVHRQLSKALESIVLQKDGTVRNAHGNVIQFVYGEDGLEPRHLQKVADGERTLTSFINLDNVIGEINAKYSSPSS